MLLVSGAGAADPRLDGLVNLREDRFAFDPPPSAEAWATRREGVRRQVAVAAGLWPAPARPSPRARVHRLVEREGYTVEAVSFESLPGLRVTGSLYRPTAPSDAPRPAVLSPHGHWGGGRFHRWDDDDLREQLEIGAESFDPAGRYPLQARCVQLARMGCVVFLYDMLGYGDSRQLDLVAIHAPSDETILDAADRWGFYSVQAELRLQGPLGVQTYNSQCAYDWLATLNGVDPDRIAVTGGSSGATQTLMLCAVDERPAAAFPVVMVSTAMQGGCGCENACCLRIGTSNVEFAALFAPKPLGMASADDWTRGFAEDGWPELQRLYRTLGSPDNVTHASLTRFPHNYNQASRAAMYAWFNEHLDLGHAAPVKETPFRPLDVSEASIFDTASRGEPVDRAFEVELMQTIDERSQAQMRRLAPTDAESLQRYRGAVGGAIEALLGGAAGSAGAGALIASGAPAPNAREARRVVVRNSEAGVDLPAVAFVPERATAVAVIASDRGKRAVAGEGGAPTPLAEMLLERSVAVIGVDLFAQGDLAPSDGPLEKAPVVPGQRPVPSLTYGYNRTPVAHRAGDLLAAVSAAQGMAPGVERVGVIALNGSTPYAAPALAVAGDRVDAALVDTGGFRWDSLTDWRDPRFLPGAVKYGDLPGLLALSAPRATIVCGESTDRLALVRQAFQAAGATLRLVVADGGAADRSVIERFIAVLAE
ncbi:hypothetical protein [Botrimarina sp.]|uniref:alpha/beta hydrolase family protein n=1 Tax=Botrimarina sp. TaxID=2795802 RepID=UPI0032ED149B